MNPQEAQQAQAVAEIKDALKAGVILYSDVSAYLKTTLKIVDSQAQKIAEARMEARSWRHKAFGEPTSKLIVESMIAENSFPWEKP